MKEMRRKMVIFCVLAGVVGVSNWSCGDDSEPGGVQSCPGEEIDCDIVQWDDATYFDPATSILQFAVNGEVTEIDRGSLSYSISDGSGIGGQMGDLEGDVEDGSRLKFDLSEVDVGEGETLELGTLRIVDVCEDTGDLMLDAELDLDGDEVQDEFECSVSFL